MGECGWMDINTASFRLLRRSLFRCIILPRYLARPPAQIRRHKSSLHGGREGLSSFGGRQNGRLKKKKNQLKINNTHISDTYLWCGGDDWRIRKLSVRFCRPCGSCALGGTNVMDDIDDFLLGAPDLVMPPPPPGSASSNLGGSSLIVVVVVAAVAVAVAGGGCGDESSARGATGRPRVGSGGSALLKLEFGSVLTRKAPTAAVEILCGDDGDDGDDDDDDDNGGDGGDEAGGAKK